jgi:hypothetical protein
MKKLESAQLENVLGGGPEECADFAVGAATLLVKDPIFFLTLYDPILLSCLH